MSQVLTVGKLDVVVSKKDIKNIHLAVNPPDGHVTASVPTRTDDEVLRLFIISKLGWIRREQRRMTEQERVPPREYLPRESHWVWGARYLLQIVEEDMPPTVTLRPKKLWLRVRPGAGPETCHELLSAWYRSQVREVAQPMIDRWAERMNVTPTGLYVQRMKTKWGSCNPDRGTIRLNSELGKKSPECLEYVVVHELAHLIEPTHNERFRAVMDAMMPAWPERRNLLNSTPLAQEDWSY